MLEFVKWRILTINTLMHDLFVDDLEISSAAYIRGNWKQSISESTSRVLKMRSHLIPVSVFLRINLYLSFT